MYVCKSSRKIVIEARTEASSRRAFIGYIFLSTNNHPHLETNDFTLLLFLLLFLFLFLLIPHLFVSIFDVKTLLFSALKRLISNPQTLKLILPHEYTPRRRNRDRERTRSKMGKHRDISLPCITRANLFLLFRRKWIFSVPTTSE